MNNFVLIQLFTLTLLCRKNINGLKIVLISIASLFVMFSNLKVMNIQDFISYEVPLEILIFNSLAVFEILSGRIRNAIFIIYLGISYLLNKAEYLYLLEIITYTILNLNEENESFLSKTKLLVYVALWPVAITLNNYIPGNMILYLFPLLMSYFLIYKSSQSKMISGPVFFGIVLSQVPFIKLTEGLILNQNYISVACCLFAFLIIFRKNFSKYLYPLIFILPAILNDEKVVIVFGILLGLKLLGENDNSKNLLSYKIDSNDIIKILFLFISIGLALYQIENVYLMSFVFIAYLLDKKNTPIRFLATKENNFFKLTGLVMISLIGLCAVIL